MNFLPLKELLISEGAALAGVGDVSDALPDDLVHLKMGVSIAVRKDLNQETVALLLHLQKTAESYLRARSCRFFSIPPDSDRRNGTFASRLYGLFSHKTAATCAGLGWIGKNGLVINPRYGPKLSWATVLTDAPFRPATPIKQSHCGNCDLCVTHCPCEALTGAEWSRQQPFVKIFRGDRCRSLKKNRTPFDHKPNCGLCINICPYARKVYRNQKRTSSRSVTVCSRL